MCLNLCGLPVPPSESELAEAFATTVSKRFEFWDGSVTHSNVVENGRTPADPETVRFPFVSTMTFDRPVEVSYGGRDYAARVSVHGRRLEHWLAALEAPSLIANRFLHSPARMDEYFTAAAVALSEYWPRLEDPSRHLRDRSATLADDLPRHERLDQAQVEFAAKNFALVVELLAPLEGSLFKSDQKRLDKARRKTR